MKNINYNIIPLKCSLFIHRKNIYAVKHSLLKREQDGTRETLSKIKNVKVNELQYHLNS